MIGESNEDPLVSIGIPTYNRADYLPALIDCWLAQTCEDFEIIIVDDASNDGTREICERYARGDKRVRYIRNEKNLGILPSFKMLALSARGKYFIWAEDDDLWDRKFLEVCLAKYREYPELIMVFSDMVDIDKKGTPIGYPDYRRYIPYGRSVYERMRNHLLNYFSDGKNQLLLGLWNRSAILSEPLFGMRIKDDASPYYWGFDGFFVLRGLSKGSIGFVPERLFFRRSRVLDEYRPPRWFLPRLAVTVARRLEKIFASPYFWYVARHIASAPGLSFGERLKLQLWNILVMMRLFFSRKI